MGILSRLLGELVQRKPTSRRADPRELYPELEAHARAPLPLHARILFGGVRIGSRSFEDILAEAIDTTGFVLGPAKALRRRAATLYLMEYFRHARSLPGRWAECGVFAGTMSLALCLAARAEQPGFDGSGLHLVDSFEGLSAIQEADTSIRRGEDGGEERIAPPATRTNFAVPIEHVRAAMAQFPGCALHKGWIPAVLAELPESAWSFVHVDVDLHEPTLACLEYFYPRLSPQGVIACDDYGSPAFPGARRAWDAFCKARNLPFVVLPTGQSVLMKS
jgi:hypothetical protein